MYLASHAVAAPQAGDIPTFESGRHQFTILRPQREVPSIKLFRLEGGVIDLSSLRGKPVLLNFWASWCAACRTELPILERQYRSAWRRNLHVAALSADKGSRATNARVNLSSGSSPDRVTYLACSNGVESCPCKIFDNRDVEPRQRHSQAKLLRPARGTRLSPMPLARRARQERCADARLKCAYRLP